MRRSAVLAMTLTLTMLALVIPTRPASAQLERLGAWAYGPSYAIDDDPARDLAYMSSGGVVRIVDLADFGNPQLIADIHSHGLVEDVFYDAATQRLFLACGYSGLEIWDVATPASPALLSRTDILYFGVATPVGHVEVMGDIAVLECAWGYVHTVDVSIPTAPVQVAFNGTMGNPAHDINIGSGGYVHTTGAQYYVRLDVSSSGTINTAGSRDFDFGSGAVFGTSEIAYVGYGGSMYILDLLAPGFLPWAVINVGGIDELEVHDGRAYLVNNDGFKIYDVTVPNSPFFLGSVFRDRLLDDLVVTPPYAYAAASRAGLEVFDTTDPTSPTSAASFTDSYSGTSAAVIDNGLAYIAAFAEGLVIVDTSHLEGVEMGRYDSPGSTYDVALDGTTAYLADVEGGLRVVDVSTPSTPAEIGSLDDYDVWRVASHGGVVYAIESIPNQPYMLHTIDVSTPAAPTDLGVLPLPDSAWGLEISGDRLFVAADAGGVIVYDISVPTAPVQLTSYPIPSVTEVDIVGDLLVAASFDIGTVNGGLYVVDISDPMMPAQLAHLYDPGFLPFHVHTDGRWLYAGSGDDLRLYDVSDPSNPQELQSYTTPWDVFDIASVDGAVYASCGHAGLLALDNTLWTPPSLIFADGFESGDVSAWSSGS